MTFGSVPVSLITVEFVEHVSAGRHFEAVEPHASLSTQDVLHVGDIGYTDILVRHLTNDHPKVLGSLERLAAVRAAVASA